MVCIDATFDELTKLALNAYLVSNEDVNCDEELIAPLNDVKNEPVSLSVIQLPLTLSIAFNLFTKLPVEILVVYSLKEDVVTKCVKLCSFVAAIILLSTDVEKSLNEDVCNLALIPFVNAVFNDDCEDVNEFNEVISVEELINPNVVICADEDIVPAGIVVDELINPNDVICADEDIVPVGIVTDELINPNAVICADELITLLPFDSNEDVTDSKDANLSLSNIFTLDVTASARTSNSIL